MEISTECVQAIRFPADAPAEADGGRESQFSKWSETVRRSLYSGAVLVSPEITPGVHDAVASVLACFSGALRVEAFVRPDPVAQAYCVRIDDSGHVGLVLTSGLVQLLSDNELRFVVGHELGHYIFRHYLNISPEKSEAGLELQAALHASRAAEISADRIGFLVSPSIEDAFRAMLKVASGLSDDKLKLNVSSYLSQLREMKGMGKASGDSPSTHPIFPIRARALLWFSMCDEFYRLSEVAGKAPLTLSDVDRHVARDMTDIEGASFEERESVALQSVAVWAALFLAGSDRRISKRERAVISSFVDNDRLEKSIGYLSSGHTDVASAIESKLKESIVRAKGVRRSQVQELLQLLSRVAQELEADEDYRRHLESRIRKGLLD